MPTVTVMGPPSVTVSQSASVLVTVTGNASVPTGTVTLSSGTYESSPSTLNVPGTNSNGVYIIIPSGVLALGTDTITANYTSNSNSYNNASRIDDDQRHLPDQNSDGDSDPICLTHLNHAIVCGDCRDRGRSRQSHAYWKLRAYRRMLHIGGHGAVRRKRFDHCSRWSARLLDSIP